MARMICCGVTVIEFIITPNGLRVSLMAFKTAPEASSNPGLASSLNAQFRGLRWRTRMGIEVLY